MKFKRWNDIAELVGIGAVVASLLLVMIELRGNTEALQAQTINAVYQAETQRRLVLITNDGGIADLIEKSRNEVLTGTDGFRLARYYTYLLDTFEYQFGEVQNGRLPKDILSVSAWRGMYGQPGLVSVYENTKLDRDPAFVEYWEEHVVKQRRQTQ